jgi:mono/diheme cytochrome c family protein
MSPRVPDLTVAEVQERSDGALFHIIQNGVRWTGMPAWQTEHSPEETWRLVSLIRRMPTLTAADLTEEKPAATTGEHPPAETGHVHPGQ